MAELTINIPNDRVDDLINALTEEVGIGYQNAADRGFPGTQAQYARVVLRDRLKEWVVQWEINKARADAKAAAIPPDLDVT